MNPRQVEQALHAYKDAEAAKALAEEAAKVLHPIVQAMEVTIGQMFLEAVDSETTAFWKAHDGTIINLEGDGRQVAKEALVDVYDLCKVLDLLRQGKIQEADECARLQDTAVKEYIPDDVWEFFNKG